MPVTLTIITLPLLGAAISLLLWPHPRSVKWLAGLVTGATVVGLLIGDEGRDAAASSLMMLFAVSALAAIMGQQRGRQAPVSYVMILLTLGLSLGTLAINSPIADLLLAGMMAMLAVAVWTLARVSDSLRAGAVVSLGVGVLALLGSEATSGVGATVLQLIAYASLLPLFPLQGGFVGSLASLPGTLPAFLAVVLPCLGWHGLSTITSVPAGIASSVVSLAIAGAVLGIVRAAVQIHLARALGSIAAALLATVWWYLGGLGTVVPTAWYTTAISVASSGLLLGAHVLEARYGVREIGKVGGLARPMPRFAVLIALLFMAAMGLPLFGVFSGFMTMMVPAVSKASTILVLLIWFVASLLLLKLWHRLFYGRPREDLRYQDLTFAEVLPFAVMLALLVFGGRAAQPVLPVNHQSTAPNTVQTTATVTSTEAYR